MRWQWFRLRVWLLRMCARALFPSNTHIRFQAARGAVRGIKL